MNTPGEKTVKLFIAGDAPNSRMALENLKDFLESFGGEDTDVEIIDVLKNPSEAVENGIYITPALLIGNPGTGTLIYGNLSSIEALKAVW